LGGASPQTTNLSVGATVIAKCTVTAPTAFDFGSYDPVVINRTANLDVTANSLSVSCTRGAPGVTVTLSAGSHAVGSTRYMVDASSHTLQYELYTTSARTTVWNTTNSVSYASTTMAAASLPVYGRIPGGQDAYTAASYSDSVTATVNF
jgi:spore coat protein U domain-containing protein, fimbrial subunit CupE1/2/3/6